MRVKDVMDKEGRKVFMMSGGRTLEDAIDLMIEKETSGIIVTEDDLPVGILTERDVLGPEGVSYNPYEWLEVEGPILAMVRDGEIVPSASPGDKIEVILPKTGFYIEAGGQVADTGAIVSTHEPGWEIQVSGMRQPAAGIITHVGEVTRGEPSTGETGYCIRSTWSSCNQDDS